MLSVFELRQYTLRPGQRDVLIDLFDRHFVEPQEAVGVRVLGQFRDLDRPDMFVWLRGFDDMPSRRECLLSFYSGAVWARYRDAANATMIDSDDVLLLRPLVDAAAPFSRLDGVRPPASCATARPGTLVSVAVYPLTGTPSTALRVLFRDEIEPALAAIGGTSMALLESEPATNNFPRLPVREGVHALVHVVTYQDAEQHQAARRYMADSAHWRSLQRRVAVHLKEDVCELRLQPTDRSLLQ